MSGKPLLEKKIVAVSSNRRLTIPKKIYSSLNFGNKVECFTRGNELVLRPVSNEDFSDLIVAELQAQGVEENFLPEKLAEKKSELKISLNTMIADAKKIAHGEGDSPTFGELFGDD